MSKRGSRSAVFIGKNKDPHFKKVKLIANFTDVKIMESLFNRLKTKPWSPSREKALGKLSSQIDRAKKYLNGVHNSTSF